MELLLILCVLCAGLSYFITRDRAPDKAPLGTLLGLILGPVGVGLTFLLKPDSDGKTESLDTNDFESLSQEAQYEKVSSALNAQRSTKSVEELRRELERMKSNS